MTEIERLKDRLRGVKSFGVTWGPEAHKLSAEELAKQLNVALDAIEAGDYEDAPELGDSYRGKGNG